MNKLKKILCMLMALLMVLTVINTTDVSASVRPKLNKKKVTIYVGKTFNLKIKNYKEKVKWFSEDKRIATVNKKGKVTAKKEGTVTICATVSNFVLLCKVKVKRKKLNYRILIHQSQIGHKHNHQHRHQHQHRLLHRKYQQKKK